MKRSYISPVIEKITFDYKNQILTSPSGSCFGSVVNVTEGNNVCGSGTPSYIGWNSEHPGPF